MTHTFTEK